MGKFDWGKGQNAVLAKREVLVLVEHLLSYDSEIVLNFHNLVC